MQEHVGVGVQEGARPSADVRGFEGAPRRRKIDVPLGGTVDRRWQGPFSGRGHRIYQGSEYVLTLVKLFIASCTPSL